MTNSDRTISRQRRALPAPGMARPDWDILADVGRRMGFAKAFDYTSEAEIFREYAALSTVTGRFGRDFDISALKDITDADYEGFPPQRWPLSLARSGGRFFADGGFYHADGKAKLLPVTWRPPAARTGPKYPFVLNTGRLRDQWHTMTRTGLSARLSAHLPEPFVDIHPGDAARLGIAASDLVSLTSPHGTAILRARITSDVQPGQVFASMHWTGETAPCARIDTLVAPACDPVSGQPESKASVVDLQRYAAAWYGFAVSRGAIALDSDYWALAKTSTGYRAELAGLEAPVDWTAQAKAMFNAPDAKVSSIIDTASGSARVALHEGGALIGALFVAKKPVAVMRDYLTGLPGTDAVDALQGRPAADVPSPGPVLCSCFGVGINTIATAIETQGLMSVEAIGRALSAGTNCGSCRPEIADVLARLRHEEAAQ